MKEFDAKVIGMAGMYTSQAILIKLIERGVLTKSEVSDLLKEVSAHQKALDTDTATNANKDVAEFLLGIAKDIESW